MNNAFAPLFYLLGFIIVISVISQGPEGTGKKIGEFFGGISYGYNNIVK